MRRSPRHTFASLLAATAFVLALPRALHAAYLDPGTGSLIAQLLAAFIFGGIATLKLSGRKLKSLFSSTGEEDEEDEEDGSDRRTR